ncbi:MAG: FAD-dependent monooxygenase [Burkholderiales bacterium]|nr:FAD-dependent monooxygenase [Burkholderiales bacterium]
MTFDTDVLIAGGGPVGMTLALDLARRGVRSIVAERNPTTTAHPKMDITNARSMELFRGVGIDAALRRVAVPEDHCFDVAWVSAMNGHELHRFGYPSVTEHRLRARARNDGSSPAEAPMRVSQVVIEPALRAAIEAEPLVDVRFGVAFEEFTQDRDGVDAVLRARDGGAAVRVRARYLAGCDGGSSRVRECLGIGLAGDMGIMQRYMVHFRSARRDLLMRWGIAWHYQSAFGTLIAQNDRDVWTLHARLPRDVALDAIDPADLVARFAGAPVELEVLVANPWVPHLVVAESYGRGRVVLAGDAAHQYIPTGGYGMNTGVCEAFDLGWKLAALLGGCGGPGLLASYAHERRPVAVRNREASRRHSEVRAQIGALYVPALQADGPDGDACRRDVGARIAALGNAENESWGIEFGYAYRDSPIVAAEPDADWVDDPLVYRPTTAPGARLPSVYLADGSQLYDRLSRWFTVLVAGTGRADAFESAARTIGVPLAVVRLDDPALAPIYAADLVLVRPDHHVAWRGAAPRTERDALAILRRALGWEVAAAP